MQFLTLLAMVAAASAVPAMAQASHPHPNAPPHGLSHGHVDAPPHAHQDHHKRFLSIGDMENIANTLVGGAVGGQGQGGQGGGRGRRSLGLQDQENIINVAANSLLHRSEEKRSLGLQSAENIINIAANSFLHKRDHEKRFLGLQDTENIINVAANSLIHRDADFDEKFAAAEAKMTKAFHPKREEKKENKAKLHALVKQYAEEEDAKLAKRAKEDGKGERPHPRKEGVSTGACSVGDVQCCNQIIKDESKKKTLAGLAGIDDFLTGTFGLNCNSIPLLGGLATSSQCKIAPVCCTNVTQDGLINFGCMSIPIF